MLAVSFLEYDAELSDLAYFDVAIFTFGPAIIALTIGVMFYLVKKSNAMRVIYTTLIVVGILGIPINLFAAYLLWWSAGNA